MENRDYVFEDFEMLDDTSLGVLLSECPYRLLTLALKATPQPLRQRMLGLLTGNKKQLLLKDLETLRPDELGAERESVMLEINQSKRQILKVARGLLDVGKILLPG